MDLPLFFTFWSIFIVSSTSQTSTAASTDTLGATQILYHNQTLVSSGQRFELGFFSPRDSTHKYLGIWYKNLPFTVVWIGNRDNPITTTSGSLRLNPDGQLLIYNDSTKVYGLPMTEPAKRPLLQLLNNGNLVVRDENSNDPEGYYWESFDYPSDTLLPGMKLGWNLTTRLHRQMTSWNPENDPSEGEFTFSLDPPEIPQLVLRRASVKQYRWGPWDSVRFSGSNALKANPVFRPMFISNAEEVYYAYQVSEESIVSRFVVTNQGIIQYLTWSNHSNEWVNMVTLQRDNCDRYQLCGPYANCFDNDPNCRCLKGFEPKSQQDWALVVTSGGCTRIWKLSCGNGDGFVKYKGLKLPDNSHVLGNRSLTTEECGAECLKNCSCMAYTLINIQGNGGQCAVWFSDLVDMRNYPSGGENLYIRMAAQELESIARAKRKRLMVKISIIVISVAVTVILCGFIGWYIFRKRREKRKGDPIQENVGRDNVKQEDPIGLPMFDFHTMKVATNNFSITNKLGQGGFGPVYKGKLQDGKDIAVKRLSNSSGQGIEEFKNEIILISKLQHRNLVRLLGCCIEGEEKLLIYEYMSSKSLDTFLFEPTKRAQLDWAKRFSIIQGIARGLLYLHRDSCPKVIHRDLKASNILLDGDMNPKISDFGLARTFRETQDLANTHRVVGTFGYMSPEYTMRGIFSEKSDVFSFGVLLLELVSGIRNTNFHYHDQHINLLGYAWELWNQHRGLDLLDPALADSFSQLEVMRCIHVGLLCGQDHAADRPSMSAVVLMLSSETDRPPSKRPTFTFQSLSDSDRRAHCNSMCSKNEITLSIVEGR